jgi:hypothetical protein
MTTLRSQPQSNLPSWPLLAAHQSDPARGILYMAPVAAPAQPELFRCSIDSVLTDGALLALQTAPPAVRQLELAAGFSAWLPAGDAYDLLEWCGSNGVGLHVARPRAFEGMMPDHRIGHSLLPEGILPETAAAPQFQNAIRKNDQGMLFALEIGPHGPCGVRRLSVTPEVADELVAGDPGIWVSDPAAEHCDELVILQSALDAVAYHQANPPGAASRRYAALAIPLTPEREALLAALIESLSAASGALPRIVVASGSHATGQWFAREITDACAGLPVAWQAPAKGRGWFEAVRCARLGVGREPSVTNAMTIVG